MPIVTAVLFSFIEQDRQAEIELRRAHGWDGLGFCNVSLVLFAAVEGVGIGSSPTFMTPQTVRPYGLMQFSCSSEMAFREGMMKPRVSLPGQQPSTSVPLLLGLLQALPVSSMLSPFSQLRRWAAWKVR